MDLYELKSEISSTEADIEYYKEERERIMTKLLPKASDPSKELVRGGISDKEYVMLQYIQMGTNLDNAIEKLDNLLKLRDKKYNIFKEANDYDKQIYMEKKLLRWSNSRISLKHNGIGKSQIYRIIKKIEKKSEIGEKRGKL